MNKNRGFAPLAIILIIAGVLILAGGGYFVYRYIFISESDNCRMVRISKMIDKSYICTEETRDLNGKPSILIYFRGQGIPVGAGFISTDKAFYLDPNTKKIIAEDSTN